MLICTLAVSLLGKTLAGKEINTAGEGALASGISEETKPKRQGRGIVSAVNGNKRVWKTNKQTNKQTKKLILTYVLTNFEIQKYDQNQPIFNGVYSGDNLAACRRFAMVRISDNGLSWK